MWIAAIKWNQLSHSSCLILWILSCTNLQPNLVLGLFTCSIGGSFWKVLKCGTVKAKPSTSFQLCTINWPPPFCRDTVLLLNRLTEVINFWQDGDTKHSIEEARAYFPDCVFAWAALFSWINVSPYQTVIASSSCSHSLMLTSILSLRHCCIRQQTRAPSVFSTAGCYVHKIPLAVHSGLNLAVGQGILSTKAAENVQPEPLLFHLPAF